MEKKKVALLIDAENVSFRYIPSLMEKVNEYIESNENLQFTHKLAFANWIESDRPEWVEELKNNGIQQKHTPAYSKGKNGADISLVVYAMDAALTKDIDTFILMTTDSDFTDLAYKLTEYGKTVIICGNENTSKSLRHSGNQYWELEKPISMIENKIKKETEKELERLNAVEEEKNQIPPKHINNINNLKTFNKTINPKENNQRKSKKENEKKARINIAIEAYKLSKQKNPDGFIDMSILYADMKKIGEIKKVSMDYHLLRFKKLKNFLESFKIFMFKEIDKKTTITYFVKLKRNYN